MRNFERLIWIVLVALFATLAFQKQPVVTLAAPPKLPSVEVVQKGCQPGANVRPMRVIDLTK